MGHSSTLCHPSITSSDTSIARWGPLGCPRRPSNGTCSVFLCPPFDHPIDCRPTIGGQTRSDPPALNTISCVCRGIYSFETTTTEGGRTDRRVRAGHQASTDPGSPGFGDGFWFYIELSPSLVAEQAGRKGRQSWELTGWWLGTGAANEATRFIVTPRSMMFTEYRLCILGVYIQAIGFSRNCLSFAVCVFRIILDEREDAI